MVDTYVSGAYGEICVGSSPISDNKKGDNICYHLFYLYLYLLFFIACSRDIAVICVVLILLNIAVSIHQQA